MDKKSFEILSEFNLPMPIRYNLTEAISMPPATSFYLRHSPEFHYLNKVINKNDLDNDFLSIKKMLLEGKLVYIEESIPSLFGACLYIDNGLIYGEIIQGHIIGLLRRGMCGQRFYINQDKKLISHKTFQQFYFLQERYGYSCNTNLNPVDMTEQISNIIKEIVLKLPNDINDLLLEILITENRIICCDAKYPKLLNFMEVIKRYFINNEFYSLFTRNQRNKNMIIFDNFDIDINNNQINMPKNIIVNNSALLSHFITKQWNLFESILVLKDYDVILDLFENYGGKIK